MGVFDRLGDVIKSYLNDEDEKIFSRSNRDHPRGTSGEFSRASHGDPDLDAAFEELNDFLGGASAGRGPRKNGWRGIVDEESGGEKRQNGGTGASGTGSAYNAGKAGGAYHTGKTGGAAVPEALQKDFAELGLAPDASAEECKAAYKKLLKIHHPDRHAGHEGNMKKATEKSARINAAYDRIVKWQTTGIAN
jgi:hypothetical protein